eukprot:15462846-Alexandrium_andersonii.AAC.1
MIVQVDVGEKPLSMDGKVVIEEGQALVYPVWWADTATNNVQNRFKEITHEIEDVIRGLPEEGFLDAILQKVRSMSNAPGYFKKMYLTPEALQALETHNREVAEGRRNRSVKPWNWDHLLGGFFGTHCESIAEHETLQQEDV